MVWDPAATRVAGILEALLVRVGNKTKNQKHKLDRVSGLRIPWIVEVPARVYRGPGPTLDRVDPGVPSRLGPGPGHSLGHDVAIPYKFIGLGAVYVTKPYEFIGFGAMDDTKPNKFIDFWGPWMSPYIQIHGRNGQIAKPKKANKCQKVCLAHFFTFVCILGFCDLPLWPFICIFGVFCFFFFLFSFWLFCSWPRPVWADADANGMGPGSYPRRAYPGSGLPGSRVYPGVPGILMVWDPAATRVAGILEALLVRVGNKKNKQNTN